MRNLFLVIGMIILFFSGSLYGCIEKKNAESYSENDTQNNNELNITPGIATKHEANETTGFTWFSYVPENLTKTEAAYILIDASHEGTCDLNEAIEYTLQHDIERFRSYAENYDYVLLSPAIYKNCVEDIDPWVRHFPEYVFTGSSDSFFYRVDLKVSAMIDELTSELTQAGYNVKSKVFLVGFSIGGHFANRYALLHPDRVKAFAAGGLGGELTLPEDSYDGYSMNWPIGVNDFEILVGEPFQRNAYKEVPQFIFWGEQDLFPYHLSEKCGWGNSDYCHWVDVFGDNSAEALRSQCSFLEDTSYNIIFKEYQEVGHEWTSQMFSDTFDFFAQYRDSNI